MSVCILQPCIAGWVRPSLLEEKEAVSHPHPLASSLFGLSTDNCVIVLPSKVDSKPVLNWKECEGEVFALFSPGISIQGQHSIAQPPTRREQLWLLSAGLHGQVWPRVPALGRVSWEGANQGVERKA